MNPFVVDQRCALFSVIVFLLRLLLRRRSTALMIVVGAARTWIIAMM
jgi:hypothetical protein